MVIRRQRGGEVNYMFLIPYKGFDFDYKSLGDMFRE